MMPTADASGCELWYVTTQSAGDPALVAALLARLTCEERARHDALVFAKNRLEFLLTRALSRWVLARWEKTKPLDLDFLRTKHGQPILNPPSDTRFNLTNTVGLVACVVSRSRDVGIDAEPLDEGARILGVAQTVFTQAERAALARLSEANRLHRAVELWTYKEAYMKARGLGMSIAPERFAVDYESGAPRLDLHELGDDDEVRWELTTRDLAGHVIATCIERIGRERCTVAVHSVTPEELISA
jgi:4'-phosphopantetheinyl transferase